MEKAGDLKPWGCDRVRFAFYRVPSGLLDIVGKWNLVFISLS